MLDLERRRTEGRRRTMAEVRRVNRWIIRLALIPLLVTMGVLVAVVAAFLLT